MQRPLVQEVEEIAVFKGERAPGARWDSRTDSLDVVEDEEQSGIGIRQQAKPYV